MIIGGFLVATGKLGFLGAFVAMALGHTLSGLSWYAIGYVGGAKLLERWGRRIRLTPRRIALAQSYFEKHSGKALFATKFTVGLTIATLVLAGTLKMRFKKFSLYNFFGSVAWACVTLFFGYSFGLSFKLLSRYIESFTRIVIVFFILLGGAIALWHILQFILRKHVKIKV